MANMTESSPVEEPLLSRDQTMWIIASLIWFAVGTAALATGQSLFGVVWLLIGLGNVYRVFRPG
jgi:hypothetical protein